MTILLLYFSGAGATKYVADCMNTHLGARADTVLLAVEHAAEVDFAPYDAIIVGTPVHHAAPAAKVLDFV